MQLKLILSPDQLYKEAMQATATKADAEMKKREKVGGNGTTNLKGIVDRPERKVNKIYYMPCACNLAGI